MRLRVRVNPKSRTNEIAGARADGTVLIRVTAAAEGGKANEAALMLIREALGLPRAAVRLAAGGASRDKWIEIDGVDPEEVGRRLRETR